MKQIKISIGLILCILILTISRSNLVGAKIISIRGKWSVVCKNPFSKITDLYFYMTFKIVNKKYVVDIERKGGFLKEKNIAVKKSGNKIYFTRDVNDWKYNFKGLVKNENLISGSFIFQEMGKLKGTYKFTAKRMTRIKPVKNISGEWLVSGKKNYKLFLKANKNSLSGKFVLENKKTYSVKGTIYGNEIALVRYGYDWYEFYIANSSDNAQSFKGIAIYNDKRVVVFSLEKAMKKMPIVPEKKPEPKPKPKPEPEVKKEPQKPVIVEVNGWKPTIKSVWGGYIVYEKGRNKIWWIDETGIAHPIKMKRTLYKYSETPLHINIAPKNTNYAWNYEIGVIVDDDNSPEKVKSQVWIIPNYIFKPTEGNVIKEIGSDRIWFIYKGRAHNIANQKALLKYWKTKKIIKSVPRGYINKYQIGPNIIAK